MALKPVLFLLLTLQSITALAQTSLPPIKPGQPGKQRGDIIAPMLDEQIAAWCDFSKQIVITHTNILCAYVGDKSKPLAGNLPPKPIKKFAKNQALRKDLSPNLYEMSEYGDT